jgi:hypothetical protein
MSMEAISKVQVGRYMYVFRITERENKWRIYILTRPKNSQYSINRASCHMNEDQFGRYFICWDRDVNSFRDAVAIAASWAKRYHRYVYTGQSF